MLPPTYQKKNDVKRIDYGNIMKEEVGDNALEKESETPWTELSDFSLQFRALDEWCDIGKDKYESNCSPKLGILEACVHMYFYIQAYRGQVEFGIGMEMELYKRYYMVFHTWLDIWHA